MSGPDAKKADPVLDDNDRLQLGTLGYDPFEDSVPFEKESDAEEQEDKPAPPAGPPRIVLHTNVRALVDTAEDLLLAAERGVYQRGGELVRVVDQGGRMRIQPLSLASLTELLSDVAIWLKEGKEELYPVLPPRAMVEALAKRGAWRLPELAAVTSVPTLRQDGSVVQEPGYDAASKILYAPASEFPRVPDRPAKPQAQAALAELEAVFSDFPFVSGSDRAALIAFLLTLLARRAIDGPVPLFLVRATCPGTGKTLAVDAVSQIALGAPAARMSQGARYSEEQEKRLLALGREGVELALIDNVERALGSDVLAAALTARTWRGRVLGQSATIEVELPVFAATGNNVAVAGDLGRRVVPIDLAAAVEHPEERTGFRHPDLLAHVRRQRERLVVAGLTVLRWYVAEGRPAADMPPFGSFEAWSGLVRSALVWLGEDDPCAGRNRIREDGDPQREAWVRLLEMWHTVLGERAVTLRQVVDAAGQGNELREALAGVDARLDPSKLDARRLGYALRKQVGRILGGRRLVRPGQRYAKSGAVWQVVAVATEQGRAA